MLSECHMLYISMLCSIVILLREENVKEMEWIQIFKKKKECTFPHEMLYLQNVCSCVLCTVFIS